MSSAQLSKKVVVEVAASHQGGTDASTSSRKSADLSELVGDVFGAIDWDQQSTGKSTKNGGKYKCFTLSVFSFPLDIGPSI